MFFTVSQQQGVAQLNLCLNLSQYPLSGQQLTVKLITNLDFLDVIYISAIL